MKTLHAHAHCTVAVAFYEAVDEVRLDRTVVFYVPNGKSVSKRAASGYGINGKCTSTGQFRRLGV
jgi:hypothetical protein